MAEKHEVRFVVGSGGPLSAEVQVLLRARMRFIGLLVFLGCAAFYVRYETAPSIVTAPRWEPVVYRLMLVLQAVLTGLAWSRLRLSMRQLRAGEIVYLSTLAAYLVCAEYAWLLGGHVVKHTSGGQDIEGGSLVADGLAMPWLVLALAYGTLIPNTWQRCATVVGGLVLAPLATCAVAGWADAALTTIVWSAVMPDMAIWLLLGAGVAVYGCHKISVLRGEAFEARQLGQYRLQRSLGSGGMGEVYLAEHQWLRRPCAVKLIRPELAGESRHLRRFEREVQAMATLTHWNTVEIYDYGHAADGTFYYVMEYLPGLSLEELVTQSGPLPPARTVHFLRQACAALREAHALGVIHRDLKPGNLMVCQRGGLYDVLKLLDFGLVQTQAETEESNRLTRVGTIVGTPAYLSPEQASAKPVDGRSDMYSLGAAAYFLLTGQPPFVHRTAVQVVAAHLHERPAPLTGVRPDLPEDLQEVVLRCLEKEPRERFRDMDDLDRALAQCRCAAAWSQQQAAAWWREHGATQPGTPPAETVPCIVAGARDTPDNR
jgi:serine/threonine-protein kinase